MCHGPGQIAGGTALVFNVGATDVANYNILRNYAQNNAPRLLSKSIGQPSHGGGAPFVNASSPQYQALAALVPVMQGACPTAPPITPPLAGQFWNGVTLMDNQATLSRAALLFAARNPTAAESQAVATGGDAALRSTLRNLMQGPAFERFLEEAAETHFLTRRLGPNQLSNFLSPTDFPSIEPVVSFGGSLTQYSDRLYRSVQREGLELVKHIVRNDRPWTDMVSGNYTMMNGVIYRFLGASVQGGSFTNLEDDNEWRVGTWRSERLGGTREHTGILSTQAWLAAFPTTATNRNRHRVRMAAKQFLATDINALGMRVGDSNPDTFRVPTMEDPNCKVCHEVMDPMTAGFQNWNVARYLPNRDSTGVDHALSIPYRDRNYPKDANGQSYYRLGDNWYRDMTLPGYSGMPMPGGYTGNRTALQWLGGQMAADPRFPMGAVHFWYQVVFNREPLTLPTDNASAFYATQLSAYNAQMAEFTQMAARFATNRGNGAYNVKDLLIDLVVSRWFRVQAVTGLNASRALELADLGSMHMLNPAHLQRKLSTLVGVTYVPFDTPTRGVALDYGDFNGVDRIKRAASHTILQATTIDRLAASLSCTATRNDFNRAVDARLLFPLVSFTDTPSSNPNAIVQNIRHLHKWLLKEDLLATDPEIQRTYQLFQEVWNDRATAAPRRLNCVYDNTASSDPNYVGRSWATVIAYMVGDPKFLFE